MIPKLKVTSFQYLSIVFYTITTPQFYCSFFLSTDTYQEEIVQLLTDCLVKNTRITQVSVMVALRNLISKLNVIKKTSLSPQEEITLNSVMVNIEKAIQYAIGKLFVVCGVFSFKSFQSDKNR